MIVSKMQSFDLDSQSGIIVTQSLVLDDPILRLRP